MNSLIPVLQKLKIASAIHLPQLSILSPMKTVSSLGPAREQHIPKTSQDTFSKSHGAYAGQRTDVHVPHVERAQHVEDCAHRHHPEQQEPHCAALVMEEALDKPHFLANTCTAACRHTATL